MECMPHYCVRGPMQFPRLHSPVLCACFVPCASCVLLNAQRDDVFIRIILKRVVLTRLSSMQAITMVPLGCVPAEDRAPNDWNADNSCIRPQIYAVMQPLGQILGNDHTQTSPRRGTR